MKIEFDISKHPQAAGFDRKIELLGPFVNLAQDEVSLHLELKHYKDGIESDSYIKPSNIKLFTNKEKFVDPTNGQRVEKNEDGILPEGSISEYDFLFDYVSPVPNQSLGKILLEVIAFFIARNDADGNFDDLSNFPS